MAQERMATAEDESLWKSRLFKFGVVAAVAGLVLKIKELLTVGVVAAGAAWVFLKGKK